MGRNQEKHPLPDESLRNQFEKALENHRSGALDKACAIYGNILKAFPNHPDALHLSGLLEHQRGNNKSAVLLIRKALKGNPGNPIYHSNLGAVYK